MAPTDQQISVALSAMRADAADWDTKQAPLTTASSTVGGMTLTGVELGLLAPLQGPYAALNQAVARWCTEGAEQFGLIADTLSTVAKVYEREENAHVHELKKLW